MPRYRIVGTRQVTARWIAFVETDSAEQAEEIAEVNEDRFVLEDDGAASQWPEDFEAQELAEGERISELMDDSDVPDLNAEEG